MVGILVALICWLMLGAKCAGSLATVAQEHRVDGPVCFWVLGDIGGMQQSGAAPKTQSPQWPKLSMA